MAVRDSKQYIKSVSAFSGGGKVNATNSPTQYASRERRYMAERTAMFDDNRAFLSTDYVNANVQGLNENFYEWINTNIRLSDITSVSASSSKKKDDYKQVLFPELSVEYFPIGAKIETMGNTWICIDPSNISSVKTTAVVARCNTSYNSYDFYGNLVVEPILVEKYSMLGNDNEHKSSIVLMDGYFNVTCQLNENTKNLKENSRIILGKKAYHITGMTDFIQEFTGNRDSCHLLNFTIRVEETTESDDIAQDFVAGGNEELFDCILQAVDTMGVGETVEFTPHFIKGTEIVESTKEHPISWIWESDNELVATVDGNGNVTAKSIGVARITAKMVQNNDINATAELFVKELQSVENSVVFTSVVPKNIEQYESVVISAVYKEHGKVTSFPLVWNITGADNEEGYSYEISKDGKSVEITCISPSKNNLQVTASYNGISITATIELLGY